MLKKMHICIITALTAFYIVAARPSKEDKNILHRSPFSSLRKTVAVDVPCTSDSNCGDHGQCRNYICRCDAGYITWESSGVCAYEQRSKLAAFLCSLFVGPLGVDWFLLSRGNGGYIAAGIFKLLLGCGCCTAICNAIGGLAKKAEGWGSLFYCMSILCSCGSSIWFLVDWIRILANAFSDGNGAPLKPW